MERDHGLRKKGSPFDFSYIADFQANPTGGLQQTDAGWPRIRGTVDINFDHWMQWQGLSFHATGLWQSGVDLGGKIGTLENPSDLVSQHTTRLDSFWLQQLFFNLFEPLTRAPTSAVERRSTDARSTRAVAVPNET